MESIPFGLVLSPDHEPHHFTLISIPHATGKLTLLGELAVSTIYVIWSPV